MFGLIYLNQGFEDGEELDPKTVYNVNGALFVFLTNMTFSNLFPVVLASNFLKLNFTSLKTYSYFLG